MPRRSRKAQPAPAADRLSIRLDLASGARIGPGKIAVLEAIARAGSISGAGRALRMSYRRTWELVEELNRSLATPLVETAAGGSGGGGAVLTEAGKAVVDSYRALETDCRDAAAKHLLAIRCVCPVRLTADDEPPADAPTRAPKARFPPPQAGEG